MTKIASGQELKDIAIEFADIAKLMNEDMTKFTMLALKAKESTTYSGKAKSRVDQSADAFIEHFASLAEYYAFAREYVLNAYGAMLDLDAKLAEQLKTITIEDPNPEFRYTENTNRDAYLSELADIENRGDSYVK